MSRRTLVLGVLLLLGAGGGWMVYQRTGPAPSRPADFEALDPLVQRLLAREIARVGRWRRSPDAWLRLGMVEEANGLHGEAERAYQRSLTLRPGHAKTLHRLAAVQERLGDLAQAADTMARSAAADPSRAASWWRLAWWRIDLGQLEEAEAALEKARALTPDDPAVRFAGVRLLLARRSPAEAVAALEGSGLMQGDDAPYANHLLAIALRQEGDLEGAAQASARADGRGPRLTDPWAVEVAQLETGRAALRLRAGRDVRAGRLAEAQRRLEELLADDPSDVESLNLLAFCRLEQGDAAGSLAVLERVFALRPDDHEGTLHYVRALLRQGTAGADVLRRAQERLARVQALRPDDPGGWRLMAALADALRRPDQELVALDRGIELEPAAADLRLRAAYTALELRRFEDALARFRALQAERPQLTEAWFGEVTTLLLAGDAPAAGDALQELSRREDADPARLAKLREALGRGR